MFPAIKKIFLHSRILEPDVKGKVMVIYDRRDTFGGWLSMKQGMFSEFFSVLGALVYAGKNQAAGVWVKFQSDLYADPQQGDNWWSYFFEPRMILRHDIQTPPEIHFNRRICRYGPFGWNLSWSSEILPGYPASRPYPIDSKEVMKKVGDLVKRHIRVRPYLLERVEAIRSECMGDAFVIGIHYRGTDKKLLYPYESPSYDLFDEYIGRVIKRYAVGEFKLFIATDEMEFMEWARTRYKDRVCCYEESPRLSRTDPSASKGGTHKSKAFSNHLKGESAVMDCLLLSRCNYIIKNRSSLSDISLAFNPFLDWTMILGVNDPVYSSDPDI